MITDKQIADAFDLTEEDVVMLRGLSSKERHDAISQIDGFTSEERERLHAFIVESKLQTLSRWQRIKHRAKGVGAWFARPFVAAGRKIVRIARIFVSKIKQAAQATRRFVLRHWGKLLALGVVGFCALAAPTATAIAILVTFFFAAAGVASVFAAYAAANSKGSPHAWAREDYAATNN